MLGWDQSQVRSFAGICRHTALAALAQLRHVAIRNALHAIIALPPVPASQSPGDGQHSHAGHDDDHADDADLVIPISDAPVPARSGQPCPRGISPVKLSVAETARLTRLAQQHAAGLITRF